MDSDSDQSSNVSDELATDVTFKVETQFLELSAYMKNGSGVQAENIITHMMNMIKVNDYACTITT